MAIGIGHFLSIFIVVDLLLLLLYALLQLFIFFCVVVDFSSDFLSQLCQFFLLKLFHS